MFPELKRPMKKRRYATIEEIKTASKEELNKIIKSYIISGGDCFEVDKRDIHE